MENKLTLFLENHGKKAKGQTYFKRHHSNIDHLVTLRIITEECHDSKVNLFCCFVDFKKYFGTAPLDNFSKRLEEIMFPLELRIALILLYETIITKLKINEGWYKDIK